MVDKDKKELDYLNECNEVISQVDLIFWKHKKRPHYIIQLNPPLEKWVLKILNESNLKIEEFGYSSHPKKLKKELKDDIDDERDEKLNKLVNSIINSKHPTVEKLKRILLYLKEKNIKYRKH